MTEPISLEEAKAQLRILDDSEDAFLLSAIEDARGWVEAYTGLILTRRAVVVALPSFSAALTVWPVVSVDSVGYIDSAGADTVLSQADYSPQLAKRPAHLIGKAFPPIYAGSAVTVVVTAGFSGPDAIRAFSPNLMRAMKLLVAGYFRDRETGGLAGDVEESAKRLCRPFKRWTA